MATQNTSSALATTLRVIGVLCIIGGAILGISMGQSSYEYIHGEFVHHSKNYGVMFGGIIGGVLSCLFWFALAKCVQAATVYLNSVTPKDKAVKPWLRGTVFDEEPSESKS